MKEIIENMGIEPSDCKNPIVAIVVIASFAIGAIVKLAGNSAK